MCPGINGDGRHYLERQELLAFAEKNSITLVALSFASNPETLKAGRGYYYASQGSGQLLLDAIDQNVAPGIPILLYGFSGGAHFVSNFEEWRPDRVMAWCAYTAAWWSPPISNSAMPPGIIACGDQDEDRYGVSLEYFRQGRKLGKPWCWVSMADTHHAETPKLDAFVLAYFQGVLDRGGAGGYWRNVESKAPMDDTPAVSTSAYSSWLPNEEVANLWSVLHQP